jgi:hypothetical protein
MEVSWEMRKEVGKKERGVITNIIRAVFGGLNCVFVC